MLDASLQNELIKDMERLPPDLQRKVVEYAHSLKKLLPKGTLGKDLLKFACTLSREDADEMLKIIEEDCERIDPNEW